MNRQEALEWLVENVVKWPVNGEEKRMSPKPDCGEWFWLYVNHGDIQLFPSQPES